MHQIDLILRLKLYSVCFVASQYFSLTQRIGTGVDIIKYWLVSRSTLNN